MVLLDGSLIVESRILVTDALLFFFELLLFLPKLQVYCVSTATCCYYDLSFTSDSNL